MSIDKANNTHDEPDFTNVVDEESLTEDQVLKTAGGWKSYIWILLVAVIAASAMAFYLYDDGESQLSKMFSGAQRSSGEKTELEKEGIDKTNEEKLQEALKSGDPTHIDQTYDQSTAGQKAAAESSLEGVDQAVCGCNPEEIKKVLLRYGLIDEKAELRKLGESDIWVSATGLLTDKNNQPLTFNGEPVVLGANGRLERADGSPVLVDGEPVFLGADGVMRTRSGKRVNLKGRLKTSSGKTLNSDGTLADKHAASLSNDYSYVSDDSQILTGNGRAITLNGEELFVKDGVVVDRDGNPVTINGQTILYGPNGMTLEDGTPLDPAIFEAAGIRVSKNGLATDGVVSTSQIGKTDLYIADDGYLFHKSKPVYYKNKRVLLDTDRSIVTVDGAPVTTFSGVQVYLSTKGVLLDQNSGILRELPGIYLKDGRAFKGDGLFVAKRDIKQLGNSDIYLGPSGLIFGHDARSYFTWDHSLVVAISDPSTSKSALVGFNNKGNLRDGNGRTVVVDNEGELSTPDIGVIRSGGGRLYTPYGRLLGGSYDRFLVDSESNFVRVRNDLATITEEGWLTLLNSRRLVKSSNGNNVSLDSNSGQLIDAQTGQTVFPTELGFTVPAPYLVDDIKDQLGDSDLHITTNGRVVVKSGYEVWFNGYGVIRNGQNGGLKYLDGELVRDRQNRPVFINASGEIFTNNNKPPLRVWVTLPDGTPLSLSGRKISKSSLIKMGDYYVTEDGFLVDEHGRYLTDASGNRIKRKPNGELVYEDGRDFVSASGEKLYLTASGIVNAAGEKVSDLPAIFNSDGVLINAKQGVKYLGNGVYEATDGTLVDENMNAIIIDGVPAKRAGDGSLTDQNNRSLYIDGKKAYLSKSGNVVDKDNNMLPADITKTVGIDGPSHKVKNKAPSYGLKPVPGTPFFMDEQGRLYDADGNPVEMDGEQLVYRDGRIYGSQSGKSYSLNEVLRQQALKNTVDNQADSSKTGKGRSEVQEPEQSRKPLGNGLYVDERTGQVFKEDGTPAITEDGEVIYSRNSGLKSITGQDLSEEDIASPGLKSLGFIGSDEVFSRQDGAVVNTQGEIVEPSKLNGANLKNSQTTSPQDKKDAGPSSRNAMEDDPYAVKRHRYHYYKSDNETLLNSVSPEKQAEEIELLLSSKRAAIQQLVTEIKGASGAVPDFSSQISLPQGGTSGGPAGASTDLLSGSGEETGSNPDGNQQELVKLFSQGDKVLVTPELSLNSDHLTPIIVRLLGSDARGATMLGAPEVKDGYFVISFQLMRLKGNERTDNPGANAVTVEAIAVDASTGNPWLRTGYDRHLLLRYGVGFVAKAVQAAAEVIQEDKELERDTTVDQTGNKTTSGGSTYNEAQLLTRIFGETLASGAEEIDELTNVEPTTTLAKELLPFFQVVFMDDVYVQKSALGL